MEKAFSVGLFCYFLTLILSWRFGITGRMAFALVDYAVHESTPGCTICLFLFVIVNNMTQCLALKSIHPGDIRSLSEMQSYLERTPLIFKILETYLVRP